MGDLSLSSAAYLPYLAERMIIPRAHTAGRDSLLRLCGFGLAARRRVLLAEIDLEIPERGVVVLMGPAGAGKSVLLRWLAGLCRGGSILRHWGIARYAGRPLGHGELPALVEQNARLLMSTVLENVLFHLPGRGALPAAEQREKARRLLAEHGMGDLIPALGELVASHSFALQRRLALLRTALAEPRLLCLDETTAQLDDGDAAEVVAQIRREGERRTVLVTTHNQRHARAFGGTVALLAGGRIQEHRPTADFFAAPESPAGRDFVRTGSCNCPSPDARIADLAYDTVLPPPLPAAAYRVLAEEAGGFVSDALGPEGFRWLKPGRLGGCPQPGLLRDLDDELQALRRVGVTLLVSLLDQSLDTAALARHGLSGISFPIADMGSPAIADALSLCERIADRLGRGEVVAFHCRAGLGRTGTMLAAQLIWEGATDQQALAKVRRVEAGWVQSEEQQRFLECFAGVLAAR
jgi:ABC-type multidrug transport system ATPase subunit